MRAHYASMGGHVLRVGFTAPTVIWQEMRRIDAGADALDRNMIYVSSDNVKTGWKVWLATWKKFFAEKTEGMTGFFAPLGATLYSDDLAKQVDGYAQDLDRWYATYNAQKTPQGDEPPPVPGAGAPTPGLYTPPGEEPKTGLLGSIPWWVWVLGVGAVGALAYSIYETGKFAKQTTLEGTKLLGNMSLFPGAAAHDASHAPQTVINLGSGQ